MISIGTLGNVRYSFAFITKNGYVLPYRWRNKTSSFQTISLWEDYQCCRKKIPPGFP